jgi:hypothetical protein
LPRVFVKGSCNLVAVSGYLKSSSSIGRIDSEFDCPRKDGKVTVLHNHLAVLMLLNDTNKWKNVRDVVRMFPWFDATIERTALFSSLHDVYVLSIARDLQAGMYRNKQTGLLLPFDDINICWANVKNREEMLSISKYKKQHGLDREFLDWLSCHFAMLADRTQRPFRTMSGGSGPSFQGGSTLLILDGSEVLPANSRFGEKSYVNQAIAVNESLRRTAGALPTTYIIEASKIVKSRDDIVDPPSHFVRHIYYSIAGKILDTLKSVAALT